MNNNCFEVLKGLEHHRQKFFELRTMLENKLLNSFKNARRNVLGSLNL